VSLMFYVYELVALNDLLLYDRLLRKEFKLEEAGMAVSKIV